MSREKQASAELLRELGLYPARLAPKTGCCAICAEKFKVDGQTTDLIVEQRDIDALERSFMSSFS